MASGMLLERGGRGHFHRDPHEEKMILDKLGELGIGLVMRFLPFRTDMLWWYLYGFQWYDNISYFAQQARHRPRTRLRRKFGIRKPIS